MFPAQFLSVSSAVRLLNLQGRLLNSAPRSLNFLTRSLNLEPRFLHHPARSARGSHTSVGQRNQEDVGIRVKHRLLSDFNVRVENPVDAAASPLHEIQL